jgi:predicted porin
VFGLNIVDTYTSLGLQYDNGSALVMTEYAKRSQNDQPVIGPLALGKYGYVAAGWRFGQLLPMLVVSQSKQDVFNGVGRAKSIDNAVGASLRYDVAPNVALKAQVDRYGAKDTSPFITPRAGDNSKINVYTVGLDFVF